TSTVNNQGGSEGGLGIAVPLSQANIDGNTWAYVDQGTTLHADALTIAATAPVRNATATNYIVNIGGVAVTDTTTNAEVGGTVEAFAGGSKSGAMPTTLAIAPNPNDTNPANKGDVTISASSASNPYVTVTVGSGAGISGSQANSNATSDGTTAA